MTVGEIKAQALKLMGLDSGEDFTGSDIEDLLLRGGDIRAKLVAMTGSIDRALAVIEGKLLLAPQTLPLHGGILQADGESVRYVLPTCVYRPIGVLRGGSTPVPFVWEGESLLLSRPDAKKPQNDLLRYYPCLPHIESGLDDRTDLSACGLPHLAESAIPYYVKGELFEIEEPEAAAQAFARFEENLQMLVQNAPEPQMAGQNEVQSVFGVVIA